MLNHSSTVVRISERADNVRSRGQPVCGSRQAWRGGETALNYSQARESPAAECLADEILVPGEKGQIVNIARGENVGSIESHRSVFRPEIARILGSRAGVAVAPVPRPATSESAFPNV